MPDLSLTSFLLARIAEDQEDAYQAQGLLGIVTDWHTVEKLRERGLTRADARHVNRWSSQRVLAECEAKRQIIDHRTYGGDGCGGHPGPYMPHGDYGTGYCYRVDEEEWDLRYLAAVYAGHPDFEEAWHVA